MLAALRARASAVATRLPSVMQLGSPMVEQRRGMHFPYRVGVGHSERLIMMRNMVTSLIEHERIKTTFRKGKMVARLADRLINKAKKGGVTNRRRIQSYVKTPSSLAKLYTSECNMLLATFLLLCQADAHGSAPLLHFHVRSPRRSVRAPTGWRS